MFVEKCKNVAHFTLCSLYGLGTKRSSLTSSFAARFATLLVHRLLDLFLLCVALVLNFLLALLDPLSALLTALLLLLRIILVKVSETLDHRMDLLFLLIHEGLLEWSLRRQGKLGEQIGLSPPILLSHVVED